MTNHETVMETMEAIGKVAFQRLGFVVVWYTKESIPDRIGSETGIFWNYYPDEDRRYRANRVASDIEVNAFIEICNGVSKSHGLKPKSAQEYNAEGTPVVMSFA